MVKNESGTISIAVGSEDELVQDVAGILIEVKRQLRFKLGRTAGDELYNLIIQTADKLN